ncbi:hypothetical protein HDF26_004842 [Pedobacter cryoconitis]|uniref:DUF5977 domain-containing protein n=1 Tax=Pedobacter cryoconitis TaxID=188932 RepID=UPI0016169AFC|nr:DUF5977 domain-containing protein [Pedobacter cryoconitis]MBB6274368.1 hypothetical protein [Pedobacter cryoconitis]
MEKIALVSCMFKEIRAILINKYHIIRRISTIAMLTGLIFMMGNYGYGQAIDPTPGARKVIPVSPNAAELGLYGRIPVSLFSGLPQISVPIGKIITGGEDLDLSISYHGGGVRPEQHPGWTGLGWSLNAGGSIIRKLNGLADERLYPNETPITKYSYFLNYNSLNSDQWFKEQSLKAIDSTIFESSLPSPDEFIFNFGGYSGSFYLNHLGKWQVKSDQGLQLNVEQELKDDFVLERQLAVRSSQPANLKRIFYKFTITTPDGSKYIFGGTPESIEFSRGTGDRDVFNGNINANSWALTKIITNNGRETNFIYERGNALASITSGIQFVATEVPDGWNSGKKGQDFRTLSVVNPIYLRSIETPDQKILFSRSESIELGYNFALVNNEVPAMEEYRDLSTRAGDIQSNSKWQKLDSISIFSKQSGFLKKVAFSYSANEDTRLMLNSVKESGADGTSKPEYTFKYDNSASLPSYTSRKVDHWGYYNGRDYISGLKQFTKESALAYGGSKDSDTLLIYAGNLISMSYPTGGMTSFEYEPHEYSKVATRYPFEIENTSNIKCGGLRIRKISDFDKTGKLTEVKEYKYISNYNNGGVTSSGILGGRAKYVEEGRGYYKSKSGDVSYIDYWKWSDNSVEPLSFTNGNHVTYSDVVEKLKDNSYTIYKYSNHDQEKYRDQPALGIVFTSYGQWMVDPNISRAMERGKLLEKSIYNTGGHIQQNTVYQYDENVDRYNEFVRSVYHSRTILGELFNDIRMAAIVYYTFPNFLSKEINTSFDANGLNPVSTTKGYVYDRQARNLKKEYFLNSNKDSVSTFYSYPGDMLNKDPDGIYYVMNSKHILSPIIEKVSKLNNKQTVYIRNAYSNPYTNIYVPKSLEEQIGSGPLRTKIVYDKYDENGNILSLHPYMGNSINYLWGYKGLYPVAEIKNVSYDEIENKLTKAAIRDFSNSSPDKKTVDNFISPLKTAFPDTQISTYTYKPSIGMESQTDTKVLSTYYDYDSFQRLKLIRNTDRNIVKSFAYNYGSVYGNKEHRRSLYRNNCSIGGSLVTYIVEANKYSAATFDEAEKMALADLNSNTQNYANFKGECYDAVYARVERNNITTNPNTEAVSANYTIKFYANATCTKSLGLGAPIALSYSVTQEENRISNPPSVVTTDYSVTAATGATEASIGYVVVGDCPSVPIPPINGFQNANALRLPPPENKPCIVRRITLNAGNYIIVPN